MAKHYFDDNLIAEFNDVDWENLKGIVSGNDKYDLLVGDIDKIKHNRGFYSQKARDRAIKLLNDFKKNPKYIASHKDDVLETEKDELKINKDKMKDLLLSMTLGSPQGKVKDDPELAKQFETMSAKFQYERSNPYIRAMETQVGQSNADLKKQMAQNLAARGVSDTGEADRAVAGANVQKNAQMANLAGQDYLRQFGDWRSENQRMLGNIGNAYNVEQGEYQSAMNDYYGNLARQSEEAANIAATQPKGFNWAALGKTALGAGTAAASFLIPGAAPLLLPMGTSMMSSGLGDFGIGVSADTQKAVNSGLQDNFNTYQAGK